jgi:hypothetical protein
MKISELLEGRISKKYFMGEEPEASKLPSAASLDDEPEDELDGEDNVEDSEEESFTAGVDQFKKIGSEFGPDLYSFSSIVYHSGWDAKNSSHLAAKLNSVELDGIDSVESTMRGASGRDGGMTFVIVNGRSGEVVAAGFGEDAVSDGIVMDTLEADQKSIVDRINALSVKYARVGGGVDEETNIGNKIRNQILVLLEYNNQPVKDIDPEADAARDEYEKRQAKIKARNDADPEYQSKLADIQKKDDEWLAARREQRKSKLSAGREKR